MSPKISRRTLLATSAAALALPRIALASSPEDIMRKSREMRRGLTNSMADVTMTITSRGRSTERKMRQYMLETSNSGNRVINVFSSPADVRGVSVLTHSALDGNDQQWLLLPSVGRVKRISSSNRSGAFVGSDFAYEDLSSFELEKFKFSAAKNASAGLIQVDYAPTYSGTGYAALSSYLDPAHYQPVQNHYFNRRGEHVKTLQLSRYKSYGNGAIWRPHLLVMTDHAKGSSTEIAFSTFTASGTAESNFSANRFQRVS